MLAATTAESIDECNLTPRLDKYVEPWQMYQMTNSDINNFCS